MTYPSHSSEGQKCTQKYTKIATVTPGRRGPPGTWRNEGEKEKRREKKVEEVEGRGEGRVESRG
ncbi:hypothetical protein DVA81_18110, partial [Acinetobacter baumannii]